MKKILLSVFLFLSIFNFTCAKSSNQEAVDAYNFGIDLYQAGDIEGSILSFQKATQLDQNFYDAFYNLGMILNSLNRRDEAINAYTRAITLEPESYECMYNLGEALYKRGYLMKSVSYLSKIPETSENYKEAQDLLKIVKERQVIVKAEMEAKKQALKAKEEIIQDASKVKEEATQDVSKAKEEITEETAKNAKEEKKEEKIKQIPKNSQTVVNPKAGSNNKHVNTYTDIKSPSGIAVDSVGNVYIASYADNIVYKIDVSGKKTEFVSSSILDGPIGICIDKNDNLYVANYIKGNILKVTPEGAPYLFTKIEKPYYVTASRSFLYVTEQKTNTVVKYSL